MKAYSPAYWVKQALQFQSKPEELIAGVVRNHANGRLFDMSFDGTPLKLLNTLYVEWRKRAKCVQGCLFPTPLDAALELAHFASVTQKDTVFDPGCGLGNLLAAALECGARRAFGVEIQHWLPPLAEALNLEIQRGDYLDGYKPAEFTCVLTNPPFGNLWGQSDIAESFMARLADQCGPEVRIAAILPSGYARSTRPKSRVATLERFEIQAVRQLPAGTFSPLTSANTEMVLMRPIAGRRQETRECEWAVSNIDGWKQTSLL